MEKCPDYDLLARQIEAFGESAAWDVTLLANAAALIRQSVPELNWAGFYRLDDGRLLLGPFSGRPACQILTLDHGVCAAAVRQRAALRVDDVAAFAGHIACDAASRSELVVPLIRKDGRLWGVLDLDSPRKQRFTPEDQQGFEKLAAVLADRLSGD